MSTYQDSTRQPRGRRRAWRSTALAVILASLWATTAWAGSIRCDTTVRGIYVYVKDGYLIAKVRVHNTTSGTPVERVWHLCNLKTTIGGVTPEMCDYLYGQLLTAKTTGVIASIYFLDTVPGNGTCEQVPSWNGEVRYHTYIVLLQE